jgi:hypothetical protein
MRKECKSKYPTIRKVKHIQINRAANESTKKKQN